METSTGQKTPAAPTTPESTPERQPSEVVHEQAREQSQPSAPELPKADNVCWRTVIGHLHSSFDVLERVLIFNLMRMLHCCSLDNRIAEIP